MGRAGPGLQTGIATVVGGTINLWTQPWRPEQAGRTISRWPNGRTAGLDVGVVMTAFEDGGKLNLRLRW